MVMSLEGGGKKPPKRSMKFNKAPSPPSRSKKTNEQPSRPMRDIEDYGPKKVDYGQHLTPDYMTPKFDTGIDGRPNQR